MKVQILTMIFISIFVSKGHQVTISTSFSNASNIVDIMMMLSTFQLSKKCQITTSTFVSNISTNTSDFIITLTLRKN